MTAAAISTNRATLTTPSDREIRVERIFNAPRDRVGKAMNDPALSRAPPPPGDPQAEPCRHRHEPGCGGADDEGAG